MPIPGLVPMIEFLGSLWVQRVAFAMAGLLLGVLVESLLLGRIRRLAEATRIKWDDLILRSLRGLPTVWFALGGFYIALTVGGMAPDPRARTGLTLALIGSLALAGMRLAGDAVELVSSHAAGAIRSPTLVVNLARFAVAGLAGVLVLQNLGINLTPLITALGIGGLAVALALQDTLGNLFAGVHIILSRHVRPRDFVRLTSGEEGRVVDVRARSTTIETTSDSSLLTVPNSILASSIVKNYTLPTTEVWIQVELGVGYSSDLEDVERVTLEVARGVLQEVEGGVPDEPPVMMYRAFGESSIDFTVRMMVRDYPSQGTVRHEFIKRLHSRYGSEGIEIPFPTRTVISKGAARS